MYDYENMRRIVYGSPGDYYGGATFVPVCVRCGRFVKPDKTVFFTNDTLAPYLNATCSKCGRTEMLFEGFCGDEVEGWLDQDAAAGDAPPVPVP